MGTTSQKLTYLNDTKQGLKTVINYAKEAILPSEYTRVDYIESSGTQYINTGVIGKKETKVEMQFKFASIPSGANIIFGCNAERFCVFRLKSGGSFSAQVSSFSVDPSIFGVVGTHYNVKVDYDNTDMININGTVATNSRAVPSFTTGINCYLFAGNVNGTASNFSFIKLYSCKIYDDNTLLRNFVPCYKNSDNKIGLYDTVNNVFYENQGTGNFTYGAEQIISNNTEFRKYAKELYSGYIDILNDNGENLYNNMPKVTGTGTSLTLNNTVECKMAIKLEPNELQQATYMGKNLIESLEYGEINALTGAESYKDTVIRCTNYISYNTNATYYPSLNSIPPNVKLNLRFYNANKEYIGYSSLNETGDGNFTITSATTPPSDTTPVYFKFRVPTTYVSDIYQPLMISTNSDLTYEPYTGNAPSPSQSYPQDIHVITDDNTITIANNDSIQITLGSLEYCKIGDYKDEFYKATSSDASLQDGKWYVKKNVGKIVNYNGETITTTYKSTTGGLDTGATIYYGLTTPTYTLLNDTLQTQLDNIKNALSHDEQTNISQTNYDLPFVINATAIEKYSDSNS